jgi:hypothetical protein
MLRFRFMIKHGHQLQFLLTRIAMRNHQSDSWDLNCSVQGLIYDSITALMLKLSIYRVVWVFEMQTKFMNTTRSLQGV